MPKVRKTQWLEDVDDSVNDMDDDVNVYVDTYDSMDDGLVLDAAPSEPIQTLGTNLREVGRA